MSNTVVGRGHPACGHADCAAPAGRMLGTRYSVPAQRRGASRVRSAVVKVLSAYQELREAAYLQEEREDVESLAEIQHALGDVAERCQGWLAAHRGH